MRKTATFISVMTSSLLFSAIVLIAAEQCPVSFSEFDKLVQSSTKNQCLIVAKNCATDKFTVQQRINDLRVEIAKGLEVYSAGELWTLREQLRWIESDSHNQFI